jgi:hypothetical protein
MYMSKVIDLLKDMSAEVTCEAGAWDMPLNSNSFLFDYPKMNLDIIPYPFVDKQFDCFIALQVFEHITKQSIAFTEIMRVSRNAILSFPYKWKCPGNVHDNIDEVKISEWTNHIEPAVKILIPSEVGNERLVCMWNFK